MTNENKFRFNRTKSLLAILLFGAIGSGLWDIILKDTFFWIGSIIVNFISTFYTGYFDRLYEGVGNKLELFLLIPSLVVFSIIFSSPLLLYVLLSKSLKDVHNHNQEPQKTTKLTLWFISQVEDHKNRLKIVLLIPQIIITIFFLDIFFVSVSTMVAVKAVDRRIEIIRPYISEREHQILNSKFRLVETRDSLQTIFNHIDTIAHENSIILPKYYLFGISTEPIKVK